MKRYIIGVDVGGTHTKVALLDFRGHILRKTGFLTKGYNSKRLVRMVSSSAGDILKKKNIHKREILGLGVGVPGLVDFKKGLVFCLTNVPGWNNISLKKIFRDETGLPVFVDNDVKTMAMGELRHGAGKGYKNIICMTLGTGVGGAVIIDGALYRGSALVAGEIGHIPINENGPACNCGSSGCLEAYVGRERFLSDARKKINCADLTPEFLRAAARRGNRTAREIWQAAGRHIGTALAGVINLLNPEVVIIGGGMAGAGSILFGAIKETVNQKSMRIPARAVRIVKAKLGNDAALVGAGEMVKDNMKPAGRDYQLFSAR